MHILKTGNNKIQKNKENKHSFYISVAFIVSSSLDTSASLLLSCFFFSFCFPNVSFSSSYNRPFSYHLQGRTCAAGAVVFVSVSLTPPSTSKKKRKENAFLRGASARRLVLVTRDCHCPFTEHGGTKIEQTS